MKQKIVFATGNEDKMKEIRMILSDLQIPVLSMKEAGLSAEIVEDGATFEENAAIKARAVAQLTDAIVLADDSGLEIDYLNGEPGVYSARYLGEDTPYEEKNKIILSRLQGVEGTARSARFVCAIAAAVPGEELQITRATVEGQIALEPAGDEGFGYDPIFYLSEFGCTTAQLTPEQKNELSHRGKALRRMREYLKNYIERTGE